MMMLKSCYHKSQTQSYHHHHHHNHHQKTHRHKRRNSNNLTSFEKLMAAVFGVPLSHGKSFTCCGMPFLVLQGFVWQIQLITLGSSMAGMWPSIGRYMGSSTKLACSTGNSYWDQSKSKLPETWVDRIWCVNICILDMCSFYTENDHD